MRLMRRETGALGKSAGHWTVGRADSPLLLYILVVSHTYLCVYQLPPPSGTLSCHPTLPAGASYLYIVNRPLLHPQIGASSDTEPIGSYAAYHAVDR